MLQRYHYYQFSCNAFVIFVTFDIYQATNESSGETLAVKRLLSNDAERKQDAIREASLLRKMNHKNIVKFVTGKNTEFS